MANGYYDISLSDASITPYVTGGVGFASFSGSNGGFDATEFAWQVGAGLGFKASENVVVDLGYRYFRTSDISDSFEGVPADFSISGSNILAGIRYSF